MSSNRSNSGPNSDLPDLDYDQGPVLDSASQDNVPEHRGSSLQQSSRPQGPPREAVEKQSDDLQVPEWDSESDAQPYQHETITNTYGDPRFDNAEGDPYAGSSQFASEYSADPYAADGYPVAAYDDDSHQAPVAPQTARQNGADYMIEDPYGVDVYSGTSPGNIDPSAEYSDLDYAQPEYEEPQRPRSNGHRQDRREAPVPIDRQGRQAPQQARNQRRDPGVPGSAGHALDGQAVRALREDEDFDDLRRPDDDVRPTREVYGSAKNIAEVGSPIDRAEEERIRYYFFPTWRSQLLNLVSFFVLSILCVIASHTIPYVVVPGPLFSAFGVTLYLYLPVLILIPGYMLGKILMNIYDAKYIIDETGVEAQIGLVSFSLRQPRLRWEDIRGSEPQQTLWERILGIGSVLVGSAMTQDVEIVMSGVANPKAIQLLIQGERDRRLRELRGTGNRGAEHKIHQVLSD